MRTAPLAAVICLSLMSGCTTRRGAGRGVAVGFGTMVVGLGTGALMASAEPRAGACCPASALVGGAIIGLGGATVVVSLINLLVVVAVGDRDDDAPRQETDAVAARRAVATRRVTARALTQDAQQAVRDGDCATVRSLELHVRELDADIHDTVFVGDVGIARCLAEPPAAPPVSP